METRRQPWHHYITVEPSMALYMFAFSLTTVIEQELFVRKACLVNNNFPIEVCEDLKNKANNASSAAVQVGHISVEI